MDKAVILGSLYISIGLMSFSMAEKEVACLAGLAFVLTVIFTVALLSDKGE